MSNITLKHTKKKNNLNWKQKKTTQNESKSLIFFGQIFKKRTKNQTDSAEVHANIVVIISSYADS